MKSPVLRALFSLAVLSVGLGLFLAGRLGSPPARPQYQKFREELRPMLMASQILARWAREHRSDGDLSAAVQQLGARGRLRLPDARFVRLAILARHLLGGSFEEDCVRAARGGPGQPIPGERFEALSDQQVAELAEGLVAAMEAEVADDPPVVVPTDASVDAAVKALAALDAASFEKLVVPGADPGASPEARCRMLAYANARLEDVPEEHRAPLARAASLQWFERFGAARYPRAAER